MEGSDKGKGAMPPPASSSSTGDLPRLEDVDPLTLINTAGIHRAGNGYDPAGEAELSSFVSEWAHRDDVVERAQAALAAVPAMDARMARLLDELRDDRYAAVAYRLEMPKPAKTQQDIIADLVARMNFGGGGGGGGSGDGDDFPDVKDIPSAKLATLPWPFGAANTHPGDAMCAPCRAARLERAMVVNRPDFARQSFALSAVRASATVPGCPMCRLLLSTFRGAPEVAAPPWGEADTVVSVRWASFAHLLRSVVRDRQVAVQGLGDARRAYTALVSREMHDELVEQDAGAGKFARGRVAADATELAHTGFQLVSVPREDPREFGYFANARLFESQADGALLRKWADDCRTGHGKCNAPEEFASGPFHAGFRVIDVKRRSVVEISPTDEFVALSYTWGRYKQLLNKAETRERLTRDGGLADDMQDIPLTIRDAMLLCDLLGFAYLWVDALCIRQDDPDDQGVQIANMDAVYSRAAVTVVAACGDDCNYGLPGVRAGSRTFYPKAETVGGIVLAPIASQFRASITSSTWDTRGWTLQEKLLSRRCLVVADTQMFWRCSKGTWYEDCRLEAAGADQTLTDESGWSFGDEERRSALERYRVLATSFLHRRFTDEADGLHAIRGIENKLGPRLGGRFHRGVPELYFDAVVLWDWPGVYSRARLPRLVHFPSWSFVSLTAPDFWAEPGGDARLWGGVMSVDDYVDSNTRMRLGAARDTKICTLVRYFRFGVEAPTVDEHGITAFPAVPIESGVFEGNRDPDYRAYLQAAPNADVAYPPVPPIKLFRNGVDLRVLGAAIAADELSCMPLHAAMAQVVVPNLVCFFARSATLYIGQPQPSDEPGGQPRLQADGVTPDNASWCGRCAVSIDSAGELLVGHVTLAADQWTRIPERCEFLAVARHASNGPHTNLPRNEGWFFHCLLVERVFDDDVVPGLGGHAGLIFRKVAVMFDVDCEMFDRAAPEAGLYMLM